MDSDKMFRYCVAIREQSAESGEKTIPKRGTDARSTYKMTGKQILEPSDPRILFTHKYEMSLI
jgi:hypothetical protein